MKFLIISGLFTLSNGDNIKVNTAVPEGRLDVLVITREGRIQLGPKGLIPLFMLH